MSAITHTGQFTRQFRRPDASMLLPAGIALLIAYLTLVPIGMMIIDSLQSSDGSLTLRNYQSVVTSGTAYRLMLNSVVFAVGGAVMGTVIGTILAWLVERTNMPGRRLMFIAALVPLIMPGSLATFAWVLILSPSIGVINIVLQKLFGFEDGPLNIYNMPGMILVEGIHLSTLSFLMIAGALRSMDASLEEASGASGASILTTARRVTLPLLLPAIVSTLLIGFVRAIEGFEVPAMLGLPGRQYVLASQIYLALKTFPINYGAAGVYSTMLFVIGAAGVLLYLRLISRGHYTTVSGKGFRPRVIDLRGLRFPAMGFATVYMLALFVLPALLMLWASFQPYYAAPSADAARRMSLDNYREVFRNTAIVDATKNSLLLALLCRDHRGHVERGVGVDHGTDAHPRTAAPRRDGVRAHRDTGPRPRRRHGRPVRGVAPADLRHTRGADHHLRDQVPSLRNAFQHINDRASEP